MKIGKSILFFLWFGFGIFHSLEAKMTKIPKKVDLQVIQIKAQKLSKPPKTPQMDKKLKDKKYKVLMKNLLEDYLYHLFSLIQEEKSTVKWNIAKKFILANKMELWITPVLKKSYKNWIVLKVVIRSTLSEKKKKVYKKVAYLIQKLKSGSYFLVHLKQKSGALFVAIGAKFHIEKS